MFSGMLAAWQRNAAMRDLYRGGSASSREILETEFGHWPPRGLDDDGRNKIDRTVQLRSHFQDEDGGWLSKALMTVGALGYVHGKSQLVGSQAARAPRNETIYMNPVLMGLPGKALGAHVSLSLTAGLLASVSPIGLLGFAYKHLMLTLMTFASPLGPVPLTQLFNLPFRSFSNVMGHEHIHILQVHDKKRANTGFDMDKDYFKKQAITAQQEFSPLRKVQLFTDKLFSLGTSGYLLNDMEVQARVHTTIANGYHRWGRIPETRHEFWAACIDSGLDAPALIREEVAASKEEGVKDFLKPGFANAFARAARGFTNCDTAELNAAQRALRDDGLAQKHWDETLPFMYGHLLELYGDRSGRQKLGFTDRVTVDGHPVSKIEIFPPPKKQTVPGQAPWDKPDARYGT